MVNLSSTYIRILSLLLFLGGFSACDNENEPDVPETGPANRTVLVYMMAENSLSDFAEKRTDSDIEEMIQGASSIPDNDHLIVFLDDANTSRNPRIYEIKKATGNVAAQAELIMEYTGEACSTDPAVLEEVLTYVKTKFPAKGYGLVMWSHGSGWLPVEDSAYTKDSRSIGVDNEQNTYSNTGAEMEITALAEVLAGFGQLDFLYFDACYMQGIEVAYELRNVTDYVIGCPAETPAIGARYDRIISPMFASTADIEGIVKDDYNYYQSIYNTTNKGNNENYGCLLSAIKCDELEALATLTAPVIARKAADKQVLSVNGIQTYRGTNSWPEFYDFNGAMHALLSETADEYAQRLEQFNKVVICRVHTDEWYGGGTWGTWFPVKDESLSPYGGVSIYVPKNNSSYLDWNTAFRKTAWYNAVWKNTGW